MLFRQGFRRTVVMVAALALGVTVAGCGSDTATRSAARPTPTRHSASAAPSPSPSPSPPPVSYPLQGTGTYTVAPGSSAVQGHSGTLLRFQIDVEHGIDNLPVPAFADAIVSILGDRQGWTAGGDWRLQRVGPGAAHDFTIYLATPETRDTLCGAVFDRYTSCRNGDAVVLNISRWVHGVPYYTDLTAYRDYMVSHEVGHRLGHAHELCAGPGRPAPTMEQQTLGLHGCVVNPWPFPNGKSNAGPIGEYPLNVPTDPPSYYRKG